MPDCDYRFEVAISFAGDNKRDLVRSVAEILQKSLGQGKVFFDEWFEAEIAGQDAQIVLQNYYGKQSRLVVTCVCRRYNEKPWTQDEWRAIQAFERTLRDAATGNRKRMRFLPLRFGDGEVDGLFSTAVVPDVRHRSPEKIAEFILKRLELAKQADNDDNAYEGGDSEQSHFSTDAAAPSQPPARSRFISSAPKITISFHNPCSKDYSDLLEEIVLKLDLSGVRSTPRDDMPVSAELVPYLEYPQGKGGIAVQMKEIIDEVLQEKGPIDGEVKGAVELRPRPSILWLSKFVLYL